MEIRPICAWHRVARGNDGCSDFNNQGYFPLWFYYCSWHNTPHVPWEQLLSQEWTQGSLQGDSVNSIQMEAHPRFRRNSHSPRAPLVWGVLSERNAPWHWQEAAVWSSKCCGWRGWGAQFLETQSSSHYKCQRRAGIGGPEHAVRTNCRWERGFISVGRDCNCKWNEETLRPW